MSNQLDKINGESQHDHSTLEGNASLWTIRLG